MSLGRIIVSVRSTSGEIIAGIIIIPSIVQVFKHSFEHIKHCNSYVSHLIYWFTKMHYSESRCFYITIKQR